MARIFRLHHGPFGQVSIVDLEGSLIEHAHSTPSLNFWMAGSDSSVSVAGRTFRRSAQRAFLINSFVAHGMEVAVRNGAPSRSLVFYFSPDWLKRTLPEDVASNFEWLDLPVSTAMHTRIRTLAAMLCDEGPDEDNEDELNAEINDLLVQLLSAARTNTGNGDAVTHRLYDFRVRKAIAFMCDDLAATSRIDTLARASGISRPHLFAVFREQMNLTPRVLWNTLRLETAKTQIGRPNESLSDIAHVLGFSAASNFTRFFKQHTGVAPSVYRSALRGKSLISLDSHPSERSGVSRGGSWPALSAAGLVPLLPSAYRRMVGLQHANAATADAILPAGRTA